MAAVARIWFTRRRGGGGKEGGGSEEWASQRKQTKHRTKHTTATMQPYHAPPGKLGRQQRLPLLDASDARPSTSKLPFMPRLNEKTDLYRTGGPVVPVFDVDPG